MLEAVYRLKGKRELSTVDVYAAYEGICGERGLEPITLRKASGIITEMDSAGLLSWPSHHTLKKAYERE